MNAVVIIIGIMLEKFQKSEFTRNVFTLTSGTAIAQAIPVVLSPVLSRLYSPEDFGVLALFMSIAAILGVIATGRYELAIMLPPDNRNAFNALALSIIIATLTSFLTLLLVILLKNPVVRFFDEPGIAPWLYLLPVVVFSAGIYQAFNYWSTRHKTFKINVAGRISQSSATGLINLGSGFAKAGSAGLIFGFIIGQLTAAFILAWKTIFNFNEFRHQVSWVEIKQVAFRYRNFLKINTPHAFIDSLQDNGIVYLILYFFDKFILGSYSFAFRILKAPVGLIGSSIYQVFYQRATQALQQGRDLQKDVRKIYRNLILFGFPVFVLIFIFAPQLFSFVFGEEWSTAGEIAQVLMPWLFLNFIASPVSCLTIIMNKQKEGMYITLTDITFKLIAILVGGILKDYYLAFMLMSILCSLLLLFSLYWFHKIAGIKVKSAYDDDI